MNNVLRCTSSALTFGSTKQIAQQKRHKTPKRCANDGRWGGSGFYSRAGENLIKRRRITRRAYKRSTNRAERCAVGKQRVVGGGGDVGEGRRRTDAPRVVDTGHRGATHDRRGSGPNCALFRTPSPAPFSTIRAIAHNLSSFPQSRHSTPTYLPPTALPPHHSPSCTTTIEKRSDNFDYGILQAEKLDSDSAVFNL